MSTIDLDKFVRASDIVATRTIYIGFDPYVCGCDYCRNFRAQTDLIPEQILSLLLLMGIDAERPNEIVEYGKCEQGGRLYGVEWPFVSASDALLEEDLEVHFSGCDISMYSSGIPCDAFDSTSRRFSVRVMFSQVPWVLPEPEPPS